MNSKNKIGIVTLHGYTNYGNNLQNYALKKLLEKFGFEVKTTVINHGFFNKINNLPKKQLLNIITTKLNIVKRFKNRKNVPILDKRAKTFKEFSSKFLSEDFYTLGNSNDMAKLDTYSFFVTGSDQVWNPVYHVNLPIYFLNFIEKEKRIAYAPSISVDKLPKKYHTIYKKWLKGMAFVSVREDAGAKIIKDLAGLNAPVLADPTLLLSRDEWLSISKRASNRPDTPYLLTYFLGGPTAEMQEKISEIAQEKNMTIINLGDITERETYETGPSEFLDYINNASAFFTDSFHGVVFSIIFQTPFVVYERQSSGPSMYSRIETILDNFNMRDRESKGFKGDVFSMDFSGTHEVIDREYNKSVNYLKEALRIEE